MAFKITINRDPGQDVRTRRALDAMSAVLNSLLEKGNIVQTGGSDFNIPTATTASDQTILANQIFGG